MLSIVFFFFRNEPLPPILVKYISCKFNDNNNNNNNNRLFEKKIEKQNKKLRINDLLIGHQEWILNRENKKQYY